MVLVRESQEGLMDPHMPVSGRRFHRALLKEQEELSSRWLSLPGALLGIIPRLSSFTLLRNKEDLASPCETCKGVRDLHRNKGPALQSVTERTLFQPYALPRSLKGVVGPAKGEARTKQ